MGLLDQLEERQKQAAAASAPPPPVSPPPEPPAAGARRRGRNRDPRPRKQVTLVLNLEIYQALQVRLQERVRAHPEREIYMRDLIEEAVRAYFNLGLAAPLE